MQNSYVDSEHLSSAKMPSASSRKKTVPETDESAKEEVLMLGTAAELEVKVTLYFVLRMRFD